MGRSQQRVALITGAGRHRVGSVVARALAARGMDIALHYYSSEQEARQSVVELREVGVRCEAYRADVSRESDVDELVTATVRDLGRLDVLVTTASIWETTPLEDVTADDLRRNFEINAMGTFLCARRAGFAMAGQPDGGSIVTIGDWAIQRPYLHRSPYFVSKGAIPTLTRVLAVELADRNPKVRVNCIHPGPVMFPPDADAEEREEMKQSTLVKTANCPEVIARAVELFIDNPFVTGVCLPVDGGRTIFAAEATGRERPI